MIRLALAGRRIGNPVAPERPGWHGHPSAFLVRDAGKGATSTPLKAEDGGFVIPKDGLLPGDVLVFARLHGSTALRVVSADEHLVELEPFDVSLASTRSRDVEVAPGLVMTLPPGSAPPEPSVAARPTGSVGRAKHHVEAVLAAHRSPTGKER